MICFIPQNSEESSLLSSFEVNLNSFPLNWFKCKNPSEFTAVIKRIYYISHHQQGCLLFIHSWKVKLVKRRPGKGVKRVTFSHFLYQISCSKIDCSHLLSIVPFFSHRYEWGITEPNIWRVQCRLSFFVVNVYAYNESGFIFFLLHFSFLQSFSKKMFSEEYALGNCRIKEKCNFHDRRFVFFILS